MIVKAFLLTILVYLIQANEADVTNDITVNYGITPEFMIFYNHKDDFWRKLTLSVMEDFMIKFNPHTFQCYKKLFLLYKDITTKFASKLKQLSDYAKERLKGDSNKIFKSIRIYLKGMSKNIELYPEEIKNKLKSKDFKAAVYYLNIILFATEFTEIHLRAALKRSKKGKPTDKMKFEKIEMKYNEIRSLTKNRVTKVLENFVHCMEIQNDNSQMS